MAILGRCNIDNNDYKEYSTYFMKLQAEKYQNLTWDNRIQRMEKSQQVLKQIIRLDNKRCRSLVEFTMIWYFDPFPWYRIKRYIITSLKVWPCILSLHRGDNCVLCFVFDITFVNKRAKNVNYMHDFMQHKSLFSN